MLCSTLFFRLSEGSGISAERGFMCQGCWCLNATPSLTISAGQAIRLGISSLPVILRANCVVGDINNISSWVHVWVYSGTDIVAPVHRRSPHRSGRIQHPPTNNHSMTMPFKTVRKGNRTKLTCFMCVALNAGAHHIHHNLICHNGLNMTIWCHENMKERRLGPSPRC